MTRGGLPVVKSAEEIWISSQADAGNQRFCPSAIKVF